MKGYCKNTVAHKSCNKQSRTQKSQQKIAVMGLKMETCFYDWYRFVNTAID